MPASYYPTSVVFPREGPMAVVAHGVLGDERELEGGTDGRWRGVGTLYGTASFPSAAFTREYDAEFALKALAPFAKARVGLVGTYQMSLAFGERVKRGLPDATFVEATELVDLPKAVKSPEEQELIRGTARLQDEVMEFTFSQVRPGMRESDVAAIARRRAQELGSEVGIYLTGSGPLASHIAPRHFQNRVLREGDVLALLVEVDGPGGMFTELGRSCSLGPVPQQLQEELAFTLEAQRFTLAQLRPGSRAADVAAAYNDFMRANGRPPERRLHCHAQGYDLVERPFVRFDETFEIREGMNFAVHPQYQFEGMFSWVCDNYLIGADGPGACLHAFPQEIVEVT
jgi:Xaa-Pro aminopeptidase